MTAPRKTLSRWTRRPASGALALRLRAAPAAAAAVSMPLPTMDELVELPSEIIDLDSGPFEARFPELARRRYLARGEKRRR
jgi:hypothetical protein